MSKLVKWAVTAVVIAGILWFLQSRVGAQDEVRQEVEVKLNAAS